MMPAMRSLTVLLLLGAVAQAQQPQPTPTPATPQGVAVPSTPSPTAPTSPRAEPGKPPPSGGDMNFDLFTNDKAKQPGEEAAQKERIAKLERKVHLRRALLKWHVALGFVTLAALAATDIIGTLNYYDKYNSNGTDTGQYSTYHEGLGIGTTALFGVTGILALAGAESLSQAAQARRGALAQAVDADGHGLLRCADHHGPDHGRLRRQALPEGHGGRAPGDRLRRVRVHGRRHVGVRILR